MPFRVPVVVTFFLAVGTTSSCGSDMAAPDGGDPVLPAPDGGVTPRPDGGSSGPDAPQRADPAVLTYHNDIHRTGTNLAEKILTPEAVQTRGLVEAFTRPVEGQVHAQVLYVPRLDVDGVERDVFYVATMKNYVYAFDANEAAESGTHRAGVVWQTILEDPASSVRSLGRGVFSTPVIDRDAGEMYIVFSTKEPVEEPIGESTVDVAYWLGALDIRTGELRRSVEIAAEVTRANGQPLAFLARNHRQRPALLLVNGSIYVAFGTRRKEELIEYHGWVMRYDAKTFALQGVFNSTPDRDRPGQGGGVWGAAPAADSKGNVYFVTGNALADHAAGSYGNSIVALSPENGLSVLGAFTPHDPERRLEHNDVDLGSGGVAVLPGARQVVGGGKTGILYLVGVPQVEKLQEFQAFINQYDPDFEVDSYWAGGPHLHGTPVFWQGPDRSFAYLYHWSESDHLKAFRYRWDTERLEPENPVVSRIIAAGAPTPDEAIMPGGQLSLSADGDQNGIVWANIPEEDHDHESGQHRGLFYAFDAVTLQELWHTQIPSIPKWMPPTVADGRVIVPTSSELVFVYTLGPAW
jgi:outer membrane protein assembly factor BamB